MATPTRHTPVLVVGAGPVGMACALLLSRLGVPATVVDQRAGVTAHPKARGIHSRTMEQFRVWGIEDRVRAAGLPPHADVMVWCESMNGPLVARTRPEPTLNTPAPRSIAPQDAVEEALADELARRPDVVVLREQALVELTQDANGVEVVLRALADGSESVVHAGYLLGCDGAASTVRDAVGIAMTGPEELAVTANHYYCADLGHLPHVRDALGFLVRPPERRHPDVNVLPTGPRGDRWLAMQRLQDGDVPMSETELTALVRDVWALPDLAVSLINVLVWRTSAQVADRFRAGRVFLVGDAAHRFPPTGGYGMNSGIQDAHNLAWKLAAVVRGHAGEALLDTYEVERRPLAVSNTAFALENHDRLDAMDVAFRERTEDPVRWRRMVLDQDRHLHSEGQTMGFVYASDAVVDDGTPTPPHDARFYWPDDRPGARFPHFWLDVEHTVSTIDWFDRTFVLVCGPRADGWEAVGTAEAGERDGLLAVRRLPHLLGPVSLPPDGAVLVRPDGHVAWRAPGVADAADLRDALDTVLSRRRVEEVTRAVAQHA